MEYKRPMNELRPKLFDVMKGYTKEQLIKDILSGIIVAIIALPLSIALPVSVRYRDSTLRSLPDFLFPFSEEAVYRLADQLPHLLLSSMAS